MPSSTTGSKSALVFFMCNSRVTRLAQMKVLRNCASWKPACMSPHSPKCSPRATCAHSHVRADALPSALVCMWAGVRVHVSVAHSSHMHADTRALKCTHPVPFSYIHLRTYTDLPESSCSQQGFIYRSRLVVNVKGRKPLGGCLSCVNQPRLRALGSLRGGFLS